MAAAKDRTLRPVRPNLGLEREFAKQMESIVEEMHKSVKWWISAAYRREEPATVSEAMALDDSSAVELDRVMKRLTRHWNRRFKEAADKLSKRFANRALNSADRQFAAAARDTGFAVEFKLTAAARDVAQSTVKQSVSLITDMSQTHMKKVEGIVMRSVQRGGDVGGLAKDLEHQYKMTRKRARMVASDQNSKATAAITRVRQAELGITQAKWLHSHAGKTPRPSHEAMNGELYDVDKGMWDPDADGKGRGRHIFPGELINCRCTSRSVLPALR